MFNFAPIRESSDRRISNHDPKFSIPSFHFFIQWGSKSALQFWQRPGYVLKSRASQSDTCSKVFAYFSPNASDVRAYRFFSLGQKLVYFVPRFFALSTITRRAYLCVVASLRWRHGCFVRLIVQPMLIAALARSLSRRYTHFP